MSDNVERALEEQDVEEEEAPRQRVVRMPSEVTPGPYFPSGMSAPEAAMSGATATLSDEQKEKVEAMKAEYGFTSGDEDVDYEDDEV